MKLSVLQHDHEFCLQKGAELLGCPARAVSLEWGVEQLLRKHLRLEARLGLNSEHPFLGYTSGPKGQQLEIGLERFSIDIDGTQISVARIVAPCANHQLWKYYRFWAVPVTRSRNALDSPATLNSV